MTVVLFPVERIGYRTIISAATPSVERAIRENPGASPADIRDQQFRRDVARRFARLDPAALDAASGHEWPP